MSEQYKDEDIKRYRVPVELIVNVYVDAVSVEHAHEIADQHVMFHLDGEDSQIISLGFTSFTEEVGTDG